jgi:hypothetical protein
MSSAPGRFVSARIVHRLPVEFCAMLRRRFSSCRQRTAITFANVQPVIHVPVEMIRSVIPRPCADECSA